MTQGRWGMWGEGGGYGKEIGVESVVRCGTNEQTRASGRPLHA